MRQFVRLWPRRFSMFKGSGLVGLIVIGALMPSVASAAAGPLSLGFDTWMGSEKSSDLKLAAGDGASVIRVNVNWSDVAPASRPTVGFDASNPASPGYSWSAVDQAVRTAAANGLAVAFTLYTAPTWAEGANRPSSVQPGSWRVNAQDLGQFATAAALRYNGSFADPDNAGKMLPAVRVWQVWNEPNLDYYLSPQWTWTNGHWVEVAPVVYRGMLNAVYTAVKNVSASNRVIMAGTAPYGDQPGTDALGRERTPPVAFYRDVFCLSTALKPSCSASAHLDGVDHHPYNTPKQGPLWHAQNKDDASYPDFYKITDVLKAAVHYGRVLPGASKSVWASEIGWTSSPPSPKGVPLAKDARWYEQAFYVLWKQGVNTVMNTEIRDVPPAPYVFQDGLYYSNGQPKPPLVAAYRFPFVTQRLSSSSVQAWGRAPAAGQLTIQVLRNGKWSALKSFSVGLHQVFSTTITLKGSATLRAIVGSQASLTWNVQSA